MPTSLTVSRCGAAWSEPDGVFADLFLAGLDGVAFEGACTCPACQADDAPGSLPVVRPVSDHAMAAAAAASALVGRACALARWLGAGRALTPAKVLRPADAAAAVADLGLDCPVLPTDGADSAVDPRPFGPAVGTKGPRARSAKHLPALHPIWSASVAAGLIELRGRKAVPGPALVLWPRPTAPGAAITLPAPDAAGADAAGTDAAGTDADGPADAANDRQRLDCWARLVAGYLRAHAELEQADELWFAGPRQLLLPVSALLLYTARDAPLTPATLVMGSLISAEDDELDPMTLLTLPEQIARWGEVLQVWATAGVITHLADAPGDLGMDGVATGPSAVDELALQLDPLIAELGQAFPGAGPVLGSLRDALGQGPPVMVTPSGRDLLARVLRGQGLSVPRVGDLADTPPGELLLALSDHDPEAASDELRTWLDARGRDWEAALGDLVASASGKDDEGPLRRAVLPVVIALTAEAAGSMVTAWQQDPWLAVPVALGLAIASGTAQPEPGHLVWMAVDLLSAGLGDEDAFADLVDIVGITDLLTAPGAVAVAVGLDHPHTREVLRLLADHLDDRALARQLRQALTRGKPPRTPQTRLSVMPLPGLRP